MDSERLSDAAGINEGSTVEAESAEKIPTKKLSNYWKRFWSTIAILSAVAGIVWSGPTGVVLMIVFIQINAFREIITIGYRIYKLYELPRFRTISWYFLVCINYYFYGELIQDHFGYVLSNRSESVQFFLQNHKMISYFMLVFGFVVFVLSLRRGYYAKQFFFFGWTTVSLLAVVMQSHFFIQNIMHGLVWIVMPCLLIAINDTMAYIVGYFWPFGEKTPLISLSPKKTWQGFIGGAVCTMTAGWFLGAYFSQKETLICPVEFDEYFGFRTELGCTPHEIYKVQDLCKVPAILQPILNRDVVRMRKFQVHSIVIAFFASLIAPFGGFFASGLKRAFKIKDFGDTIPGHGGFLDRFDCHYMVGTFVYVYLATFVRLPNLTKLLQVITKMDTLEVETLVLSVVKMMRGSLGAEQLEAFRSKVLEALG